MKMVDEAQKTKPRMGPPRIQGFMCIGGDFGVRAIFYGQKDGKSFNGLKCESATMEVRKSIGCTHQLPSD